MTSVHTLLTLHNTMFLILTCITCWRKRVFFSYEKNFCLFFTKPFCTNFWAKKKNIRNHAQSNLLIRNRAFGSRGAGGVNCPPTFAKNGSKLVNDRQILAKIWFLPPTFGFCPPTFQYLPKALRNFRNFSILTTKALTMHCWVFFTFLKDSYLA